MGDWPDNYVYEVGSRREFKVFVLLRGKVFNGKVFGIGAGMRLILKAFDFGKSFIGRVNNRGAASCFAYFYCLGRSNVRCLYFLIRV